MKIERGVRRLCAAAVMGMACLALSGCLTMNSYVDPAMPNVTKANLPMVAQPHPVQVLAEFQTKGVPNATATGNVRPRVVAIASESGLFSSVSETPAVAGSEGGILKITINNVVLDDHAAAKGFGTGLTFGLAGSMVTDGYVCTAAYTFNGKTTETSLKSAMYTTIGNHAAPQGLAPMRTADAANLIVDRLTWNALKSLADKGAFQ